MRIQLIHPPHPAAIDDRLDAPLGLLRIATVLKRHGHEVAIADYTGHHSPPIMKADVYGLTCYAPTAHLSSLIAKGCRKWNPEAVTVAGGAHITGLLECEERELLPRGFDSYVIGDGERAMLDLLDDWPNVKRTYEHPLPDDLDKLSMTDYSLVDLESYGRIIAGEPSVPIYTSIGCPYRCAFCGLPKQHRKIKYRSPQNVANEIEGIIRKHNIRSFNFQDDTFLIDKARAYTLLELLEPLGIRFRCHGRIGNDNREDYMILKDAGCEAVGVGVESGSQYILDRMNKKIKIVQAADTLQWIKEAGLVDRIFLVLNFPGETRETLEETRRFIEDNDPNQFFASTFQPYPGTDVWQNPDKYGIVSIVRNFRRYVQVDGQNRGGHINIDTEWMIKEFATNAEREFRHWLDRRKRRGNLQNYERRLENEPKSVQRTYGA